MDRRALLGGFFAVLAAPPAPAAPADRGVLRLAILSVGASTADSTLANLMPSALRELGYIEGRNVVIDRRYAEGRIDRLPALARELVQTHPHVIIAASPSAVNAVRDTHAEIPIVMFAAADPIAQGWISSLARPGGRVTGVAIQPDTQLTAKRLELLHDATPRASRIAALGTSEPHAREQIDVARRAGSAAGLTVLPVEVQAGDYEGAFQQMRRERAEGLLVVASPILNTNRRKIIALAARHRLPAIYQWSEHVDEGGLMSYGSNFSFLSRRTAVYVDKIFKGASPAELPVEQPSTYELVLNLKVAKTLGLALPRPLVTRADRLVQ